MFIRREYPVTGIGLPHSDTPGSKPVDGSPELVAVFHVLHRLPMPRHPSCARICLARNLSSLLSIYVAILLNLQHTVFKERRAHPFRGERLCSLSNPPPAPQGGIFKFLSAIFWGRSSRGGSQCCCGCRAGSCCGSRSGSSARCCSSCRRFPFTTLERITVCQHLSAVAFPPASLSEGEQKVFAVSYRIEEMSKPFHAQLELGGCSARRLCRRPPLS